MSLEGITLSSTSESPVNSINVCWTKHAITSIIIVNIDEEMDDTMNLTWIAVVVNYRRGIVDTMVQLAPKFQYVTFIDQLLSKRLGAPNHKNNSTQNRFWFGPIVYLWLYYQKYAKNEERKDNHMQNIIIKMLISEIHKYSKISSDSFIIIVGQNEQRLSWKIAVFEFQFLKVNNSSSPRSSKHFVHFRICRIKDRLAENCHFLDHLNCFWKWFQYYSQFINGYSLHPSLPNTIIWIRSRSIHSRPEHLQTVPD